MVAPLSPAARDVRIDALRGIALFGVLAMNLPVFASSPFSTGWVESMVPGAENAGPAMFLWLGRGKFIAILAGLYGYGAERMAERLGAGRAGIERRRLLFLAGTGVVHGLLWPGDILVAWAVTGAILLAMRRAPAALLVLGGLGAPALLTIAGYGSFVEPARRAVAASHESHGVQPLLVAWRYLPFTLPPMVAQATLGRWLGRGTNGAALGLLALGLVLSAVPALPLLTVTAVPAWAAVLCGDVGATAMAAGAATLLLRWPARWFAPVGAAPLSNYLLQSMIFVTLAPPRLHAGGYLLLAAGTFLAQHVLTTGWLRTHARGPMEALWRRVTYGVVPAG